MKYWDILLVMAGVQLVLSALILYSVFRIANRPVGMRLAILSIILAVQSIISIMLYNTWDSQGYGPELAKPILSVQTTSLLGTLVLLDLTRR